MAMKKNLLNGAIGMMACALFLSCTSKTGKDAAPEAKNDTVVAVSRDASLGEWKTQVYEGLLPAADGPGIFYSLTVRHQEHSGDGTFTLALTYKEAENGKDKTFTYTGRRYTQRGIPGDDNATVWQLVTDDKQDTFNFLLEDAETLVLLNQEFERSQSGPDYRLKRVQKP